MQHVKKYFTEGLIQFTILLSLIGVRVDVDTYLNSYFSPLLDSNIGPTSAYIQTSFHNLRDNLDGYSLHPKCPDLEYYFTSRRLLNEVRTLGSPRFPTQLSAWLVHLVPAESDRPELNGTQSSSILLDNDSEVNGSNVEDDASCALDSRGSLAGENQPTVREDDTRPGSSLDACEPSEELARAGPGEEAERAQSAGAIEGASRARAQLADTSTLDNEIPASLAPQAFLRGDVDEHWDDFLSLSGFDDLDLEVPLRVSGQDVSLQDAMVRVGGPSAGVRRLESTNSSHSDSMPGMVGLPSHHFPLVGNCTRNGTSCSQDPAGCLDEAVFEQINLLGLGLDVMDTIDMQLLEALNSSSRSPNSPSSSEVSSGESYCKDEGAVGFAGALCADWSPSELAEGVRHDHTYTAVPQTPEEEAELSRDERQARELRIPLSVPEIVNMPVEEFLGLPAQQRLTEEQVALLRDIRRRGKNKLAAQFCRKRKLDAISGLEAEVERLARQRERLLRERAHHTKALGAAKQRLEQLSQDLLSRFRDQQGRPVSPGCYSLQCGADGRVVVIPRRHSSFQPKSGRKKKEKR